MVLAAAAVLGAGLAFTSCGSGKRGGGSGDWPEDFARIGDRGRVAYMMDAVKPDSVARFICDAALGKVEGARIDSVNTAIAYAAEKYGEDDMVTFSQEVDAYSASLPLADKMRLYTLVGKENPQGLGYRMGLEYVNNIRERGMKPADVEREIAALRKACGSDKETYRRFVVGFKTVLRMEDRGNLPAGVYERFINLPED